MRVYKRACKHLTGPEGFHQLGEGGRVYHNVRKHINIAVKTVVAIFSTVVISSSSLKCREGYLDIQVQKRVWSSNISILVGKPVNIDDKGVFKA